MVKVRFEDDPEHEEITEKIDSTSPVWAYIDEHNDEDDPQPPEVVIDLDTLAKIAWEHKIYQEQDTSYKIEVLHAVREGTLEGQDDFIQIGELDEQVDIQRPAIYSNLHDLRDAGLVEQVGQKRSGIYRYIGGF